MHQKIRLKIIDYITRGIFKHVSLIYQHADQKIIDLDLSYKNLNVSHEKLPQIFLVASLTKPVVAMAILKLVEEGWLNLNQRVCDFFPQFKSDGKIQITIRHLLAHTSGLPDLPPNNVELRKQLAPLSEFFHQATQLPLEFPPGKGSRYSSLGFMILAEILHKLTGQELPLFLDEHFFKPLGMNHTSLGLPKDPARHATFLQHLIPVDMLPGEIEKYGDWNSDYWKNLGAPWGGMFSTTQDLSKFCHMIYEQGHAHTAQILSPRTITSSAYNQNEFFPEIPADVKHRPWGLGWRLNWVNHRQSFGELIPPHIIGHYGATGTMLWIDLHTKQSLVLLTTTPHERTNQEMVTLSNMISSSS